jgi:hypothetical protein
MCQNSVTLSTFIFHIGYYFYKPLNQNAKMRCAFGLVLDDHAPLCHTETDDNSSDDRYDGARRGDCVAHADQLAVDP